MAWDMYEQMEDAEATADLVARVYRSASSQIVFAAQDIFEKYMTKHKLSQTEAWNLLNRMQDNDSIEMLLLELKNKNSGENKQELIKELEAPAYRVRIERLQDLLQQVDAVMKNVYQQEQQFDTSFFEQLAENEELVAYKYDGFWQCMDTQRDKFYLERLIEEGKAPWIKWT